MTTQTELSALKDFFAAYFHEDWNCDTENPESVVNSFVANATPAQRTVLADANVKYAAGFASDKELEKQLFRELGCWRKIAYTSCPGRRGVKCDRPSSAAFFFREIIGESVQEKSRNQRPYNSNITYDVRALPLSSTLG